MPAAWSRTWYTDVDYSLPDVSTLPLYCRSALWSMKAAMLGEILNTNQPAGDRWTCIGSSDGVTAGMDATDRWGGTFDDTKLINATPGNAHSWMVLKSPDGIGPIYLTIDYSFGTGFGDFYVKLYVAKDIPTGGSTTARPTSIAEITWIDGSSMKFCDSTAPGVPVRVHRVSDASGFFLLLMGTQATTRFQYAFAFWPLAETAVGDINPWVVWHQFLDTVNTGPMDSNVGTWRYDQNSCAMRGRLGDNTQGLGMSPLTLSPSVSGGADILSSGIGDYADGKYRDFKMPVWSWTPGYKTIRGVLTDMRVCSSVIPQASLFQAGGPLTHMLVGNTWVPFGAVPTT